MSKEEKIVGQCKSSVSKELEALEARFKRIKNLQVCVDYEKDIVKSVGEMLPNSCNKVEQALNELQAIKNAKPSDAMEILEDLRKQVSFANSDGCIFDDIYENIIKDMDTLKQALIKAQKQEKVLEIIIKKNVSVWGFRNRVFGYQKEQNGNITINDTYEYYLNTFGCYHNGFDIELLTQEEFGTLKEYLK